MDASSQADLDVLTTVIGALKKLTKEEQQRTLQAVTLFLGLSSESSHRQPLQSVQRAIDREGEDSRPAPGSFSEDRKMSAKEFLRDKKPAADIERVACLAYYLAHYREMPHFKTIDVSTLNTEAAQPKFSNASAAVDNAVRAGLLVQAVRGAKQLSAAGEHYVQMLPDRDAAKESLKATNLRKRNRKAIGKRAAPSPVDRGDNKQES